MNSSPSSSNTIYVGNIQSIKDEQLQEYFQQFGKIESLYHNCTRGVDEWLIDYRFIKFSSNTNMSAILTNTYDHTICRIRLDVHPYDAVFSDETRLTSDRKICIAHTNSILQRNVIQKAFKRYGRILNCTCVSSGNGVEYVYVEFETINSVRSVFASNQTHFAGRTSLAVKQPLRPSQVAPKIESLPVNKRECTEVLTPRYSHRQRRDSNVDTAQYTSLASHQNMIEEELRTSTPTSDRLLNSSSQSQNELLLIPTDTQPANNESLQTCSQQQLKVYEREYDLIIRKTFDEITYEIEKFLQNQKQSYKKLQKYILTELQSESSSSSEEEGEITESKLSSLSKNSKYYPKKRLKSHY
ncbi:unnamed protein product [Adineta steineri]|uniref:RRM domain-containing protein n=1 Tax=Adineta steineri TaxID=433720 RepID=A0A813XYH1_9BILA|nr:unnamed protein product [Adineta steineri]CAF1358928.1 unnamed protein product [Adineta steineri]